MNRLRRRASGTSKDKTSASFLAVVCSVVNIILLKLNEPWQHFTTTVNNSKEQRFKYHNYTELNTFK